MNVSLLSLRCGHDFAFMQLNADMHTLQYAYWGARYSQKLMFARAVVAMRVELLVQGRLSRCAGVLKRSTDATAAAAYAIGSCSCYVSTFSACQLRLYKFRYIQNELR